MEVTQLFAGLLEQDPLPEEALTRMCLQLHFLIGQGQSWEAFRAAAMAAPKPTQVALNSWLLNHWNHLPRSPQLSPAEARTMAVWSDQFKTGQLEIIGFDPERGLQFQPLTEENEDR